MENTNEVELNPETNELVETGDVERIDDVIKVEEGKSYPRTMRIEDGIVFMKQTTELKDGVHYFEYGLDTENVDGDDILKHAAKDINIVVMRPRVFKKMTSSEIAQLPFVLDPLNYPASERVGVSKRDQRIKMLVEMGLPGDKASYIADNPDKALQIIADFETSK